MLSLPNDGRYPALDLTPQQRRQRMFEALTAQMDALSRSAPVLMIFEDAHWTDPTSLEVFGRVVDRVRRLRVLLIVTFRPEFEPPWVGRPYVTFLALNRLGEREIDSMIDRVVGNKLLPASVRQDIVERTDGIPLFVEEMTKAVLEAVGEGEAERTAAAVPSRALAVPASLHASLMARSTDLGRLRRWRRSGRRSGESSPMPCWLQWCASRRRSWDRPSTNSSRLVCCSGKACPRTRPICSSTHWYRTRLTARCCANRVVRCTRVSPKLLKASSSRSRKTSRSWSRVTAQRPV